MSRCSRDPRRGNVLIDANALDPGVHEVEVNRFLALKAAGKIHLVVPAGVLKETQHRNTPRVIRETVSSQIYSLQEVGHNEVERRQLANIRAILQGNGTTGQHDADAWHIFEASKYGGYFITHDRRINKTKRQKLENLLLGLCIVTLTEFLTIYDRFELERPI